MACLWLTLCDPEPPVNGQFLYSAGLIDSVARAGVRLTVLGLARTADAPLCRKRGAVDMILAEGQPKSRRQRLLSGAPSVATRCKVPDLEASVASCLAEGNWEAIVFDSIAGAWAFPIVRRYRERHPVKLVYLAHNFETGVARQLARAERGPRRIAKFFDTWKVDRLERELIRSCDLVTANSPEDAGTMESLAPGGKRVLFLPPGFGGPRVEQRTIDARLPRRAIAVGSFDWQPKRLSLEAFLTIGAPMLSQAGVELQIVGGAEPSYLAELRRRFPGVEITGPVPDVRPYMADARLAVVPDLLGGFKLKSLDYVFNRLPMFAMDGAVPGTPLENGRSIKLFDSHKSLAQGVVDAIDDVDALNAQQELAFTSCADRFDWDNVARLLLEALRGSPSAGYPSYFPPPGPHRVRPPVRAC
jgi:glycosyltransferase involved in cell wall biosynthesis